MNTDLIRWLRELVLSFLPSPGALNQASTAQALNRGYSQLIGRTRFVKKALWPGVHASTSEDAAGDLSHVPQEESPGLLSLTNSMSLAHLLTELTLREHGSHQRPQQGHMLEAEIAHSLRSGLGWLRADQSQHRIPGIPVSRMHSQPSLDRAVSTVPTPFKSGNRKE